MRITYSFIINLLFILIGELLFLFIPSISIESLMHPTQSGKIIFFLYAIMALLLFVVLVHISGYSKRFGISLLDFLLFIWFIFIVIKSIIQKDPFSLYYAEFLSLALLYFILRLLNTDDYKWLFIALIIGGAIQAIYGNLQLWGYYPSNHNMFKLTGSFFNPGPYAGYLISVFPVALGFWLFNIKLFNSDIENPKITQAIQNVMKYVIRWIKKTGIKINVSEAKNPVAHILNSVGYYLSAITLICILLVLPASQSRAGWLAALGASVYIFVKKYKNVIHNWLNKSVERKYSMVVLLVVVLFSGFTGMYLMKKGSADGRLLIWKVTTNIIADYPITGTGINGFKAHYMDYQAEYFQQNPNSEAAMVAGDTNYAFNEFLQQTAQQGLPGGILLIIISILAFSVKGFNENFKGENAGKQLQLNTKNNLVVVSKAVLLVVIIFSLFSYPARILPIKTNLVLALAYLGGSMNPMFTGKLSSFDKPQPIVKSFMIKFLVLCITAIIVSYCIYYTKTQTEALKDWKFAFTMYNMDAWTQSITEYEKALPAFRFNGDFLTNYGKALSMAEEHDKAIEILQQAAKYYPNVVVYTALGDSYKALDKNHKAEAAYLHAWHMNPSRFYPKYQLAKLYDETGQNEKAIKVAQEILNKEIKVKSTAVGEIKAEMQTIINKHNLKF